MRSHAEPGNEIASTAHSTRNSIMPAASAWIKESTTQAFEADVIQKSFEIPVVDPEPKKEEGVKRTAEEAAGKG